MNKYTYKFRLRPDVNQASRLSQQFGLCRFIYNHFLDKRNTTYKTTNKGSSYNKDTSDLTLLKRELSWLNDGIAQSLQQELKNLDEAFNRFFKKLSSFPKFHSKHKDKQSFRVPQNIVVKNNKIYFAKFREGIKLEQHREIEGKIKNVTIAQNRSGQYFALICVERSIPKLTPNNNKVGLDLGIKNLVTCSDGKVFENIRPYKNLQRRLRILQKSLSRKVKGSHNYARAKRILAKCHQKIADIRSNHLHQVSRSLINENQVIVVEDLNIKGMMANRKLAKSVADVSLSELVRQIEYKAGWHGREFIKISRWFPSSKTCHVCDHINEQLTLSDREWMCPQCKQVHDRDYNASVNILAEGLR